MPVENILPESLLHQHVNLKLVVAKYVFVVTCTLKYI